MPPVGNRFRRLEPGSVGCEGYCRAERWDGKNRGRESERRGITAALTRICRAVQRTFREIMFLQELNNHENIIRSVKRGGRATRSSPAGLSSRRRPRQAYCLFSFAETGTRCADTHSS